MILLLIVYSSRDEGEDLAECRAVIRRVIIISGVSWEGSKEVTPKSSLPAGSANLEPYWEEEGAPTVFSERWEMWETKRDAVHIIRDTHATGIASQSPEKMSLALLSGCLRVDNGHTYAN